MRKIELLIRFKDSFYYELPVYIICPFWLLFFLYESFVHFICYNYFPSNLLFISQFCFTFFNLFYRSFQFYRVKYSFTTSEIYFLFKKNFPIPRLSNFFLVLISIACIDLSLINPSDHKSICKICISLMICSKAFTLCLLFPSTILSTTYWKGHCYWDLKCLLYHIINYTYI